MPQHAAVPEGWIQRLESMKRCGSAAELTREFGSPPHKSHHGDMEIWHYPLGVAGGMLYSIHVAVVGDDASQTYMHMEPSDAPDTIPQRRPWWRLW